MKIFFANDRKEVTMGGGFIFAQNFLKSMQAFVDVEVIDTPVGADLCFIPSPTMMTDKEKFEYVKEHKIPVVLRLDNMPRNSRNRGSGSSRVLKYATQAKAIVYQSQWAYGFLFPFIKKNKGCINDRVIYNGVDTELFRPDGAKIANPKGHYPVVIYSRHNRDELKNWPVCWYWYIELQRKYPNAKLLLLGRFADDLVEYNFDFFDDENIEYLGAISDRERYATILRSGDIFFAPYDYDACSNAVLEARASGLKVQTRPDATGGLPEILNPNLDISLARMGREYYNLFKEIV